MAGPPPERLLGHTPQRQRLPRLLPAAVRDVLPAEPPARRLPTLGIPPGQCFIALPRDRAGGACRPQGISPELHPGGARCRGPPLRHAPHTHGGGGRHRRQG